MKRILLLLTVFTLFSCNTNPPVQITELNGKLNITSNVNEAEVLLNNVSTGKLSPVIIELSPGEYEVTLQKDGFSEKTKSTSVISGETTDLHFELQNSVSTQIILVEDFANVSCDPCVQSNKILHELSREFDGKIEIIKFPVNFPSPNDPFYLSAKKYSDTRMSFYNIFAVPTVIINGLKRPISTDKNSVKQQIENLLNSQAKFQIDINSSINGSELTLSTDIKTLNNSGLNLDNMILYTCLIEKEISFQSPPGSNGETKFYDVLRKMIPDQSGRNLELTGGNQTISDTVQLDTSWNKDELKIVVFIQDKLTKEIYQSSISK